MNMEKFKMKSTIFVCFSGDPYLEGTKINSPFYLAKLNVPAGKNQFNLVVSQYEKTNTIHYTLRVCINFINRSFDIVWVDKTKWRLMRTFTFC